MAQPEERFSTTGWTLSVSGRRLGAWDDEAIKLYPQDHSRIFRVEAKNRADQTLCLSPLIFGCSATARPIDASTSSLVANEKGKPLLACPKSLWKNWGGSWSVTL